MSNTARVGFHAVYVENRGQAAVSSAGNAIVGAYLNQIGLPTSAIIYITNASPQGMQWLNFTDAQNYGIDVRPFNLTALPAAPQSSEPGVSSQISSVKKEVYEFVSATNRSDDLSLAYLQGKYHDQVNYYGKLLPKASVLADKRAFFRKWPIRNYSVQSASLSVTCQTGTKCKAEGTIDWNASGSTLSSIGSATISLLWVLEGETWKISSESSRTIGRKVTRLAPREENTGSPAYQLDGSGTKVISLSNLYPDNDCHLVRGHSAGKIVQRQFDTDGLKLTGIVLENQDGSTVWGRHIVMHDRRYEAAGRTLQT